MGIIYINISEIASYINQNKWDFITPFERIWKRADSCGYNNCLNLMNTSISTKTLDLEVVNIQKLEIDSKLDNKEITKRQHTILLQKKIDKEIQLCNEIKDTKKHIDDIVLNHEEKVKKNVGNDIIQQINDISLDTVDKRKNTNEAIQKLNISIKEKDILIQETDSLINKFVGVAKEDSGIDLFEQKYKVKLDTNQVYNKILFKETINNTYYIGGKCDGINYDKNYIVEVKSRAKGFFSSIRDYENTQIQMYMHLLKFEEAKLVEYLASTNKIKITNIKKDSECIDFILNSLNIFIKNFELFMNNEKMKMDYVVLSENDKKKFLQKLYLYEIKKSASEFLSDTACLIDDLD